MKFIIGDEDCSIPPALRIRPETCVPLLLPSGGGDSSSSAVQAGHFLFTAKPAPHSSCDDREPGVSVHIQVRRYRECLDI